MFLTVLHFSAARVDRMGPRLPSLQRVRWLAGTLQSQHGFGLERWRGKGVWQAA